MENITLVAYILTFIGSVLLTVILLCKFITAMITAFFSLLKNLVISILSHIKDMAKGIREINVEPRKIGFLGGLALIVACPIILLITFPILFLIPLFLVGLFIISLSNQAT